MRILKILALLLLTVSVTACNTVKGAGKDIEKGGEAISNTADDVEDEIDD